jgi:hypothetical protein
MPEINQIRSQAELESLFSELGIDFRKPGFYDDANFRLRVAENPLFLQTYADYVRSLTFSDVYLLRAREIVSEQVAFLYDRLIRDGRLGACIDLTLTLTRFLERHGIWNYAVSGATSLIFDESTGLARRSFETILTPENPAKCGHVWLYSPPFKIVDLTMRHQVYFDNAPDFIPSPIFAEETEPGTAEIWELVEFPMLEKFRAENGREPTLDDFPGIRDSISKYGSHKLVFPQVTINYIHTGIFQSDGSLEEGTDLCLSGKHRMQLYKEYLDEYNRA